MTIEVANRLIEYRKKAKLSQEELADKLGVSRQAVSKWERGEASPDTDNLIALAKLYNVTLDELINSNSEDINNESGSEENTNVSIGPGHIDVGDSVHVGFDGIVVTDKDTKIKIKRKSAKHYIFLSAIEASFTLIVLLVYIIMGCCYKGTFGVNNINAWAALWPLFIFIPLPSTLRIALETKKFTAFAYPLLVTGIYCFLGMLLNLWHPMWVLFITIPVYYSFFGVIDSKLLHKHIHIE